MVVAIEVSSAKEVVQVDPAEVVAVWGSEVVSLVVFSTLNVVFGELVVVLGAGVVAIPRLLTSNLLTVPKILKMDFIALVFRHHLAKQG